MFFKEIKKKEILPPPPQKKETTWRFFRKLSFPSVNGKRIGTKDVTSKTSWYSERMHPIIKSQHFEFWMKCHKHHFDMVGVVNENHICENQDFANNNISSKNSTNGTNVLGLGWYCYMNNSNSYRSYANTVQKALEPWTIDEIKPYEAGDIIKIRVNIREKRIFFSKNEDTPVVIFSNVDFSSCLVVAQEKKKEKEAAGLYIAVSLAYPNDRNDEGEESDFELINFIDYESDELPPDPDLTERIEYMNDTMETSKQMSIDFIKKNGKETFVVWKYLLIQ